MPTTYQGLLIRDAINDEGQIPSPAVNPTASPDIIAYQGNVLTFADAKKCYGKYMDLPIQQGMPNNIYVRARNKGTAQSAKVRLYCAPLNVLYIPAQWTQLKTAQMADTVDFVGEGGGSTIQHDGYALVKEPFYLQTVVNPRQHHCLFALATDPQGKWLTLEKDFQNNAKLWEWLRNYGQFANKNICIERPLEFTTSKLVSIGNYDNTPKTFDLSIELSRDVQSAAGGTLLVQSTDAALPFSFRHALDGKVTHLSNEVEIPPRYFGTVHVICTHPRPSQVEFTLSMRNYLKKDTANPDDITYGTSLIHRRTNRAETAEKLGDMAWVLTQNPEGFNAQEHTEVYHRRLLSREDAVYYDD